MHVHTCTGLLGVCVCTGFCFPWPWGTEQKWDHWVMRFFFECNCCMALTSYIPNSSTRLCILANTCIAQVFKTMHVGTCTTSPCFFIRNVCPETAVDLGSCEKQCRDFLHGPGTLRGSTLLPCRTCSNMRLLVIWLLWFLLLVGF